MIQIEYKDKLIRVWEDDLSKVITLWNERDDLMEYSGAMEYFCPLSFDVSKFREITLQEHEELLAKQKAMLSEKIGGL